MNKKDLSKTEKKLVQIIKNARFSGEVATVDEGFKEKLKEELLENYLNLEENKVKKFRKILTTPKGKIIATVFSIITIIASAGFGSFYYFKAQKAPESNQNTDESTPKIQIAGNLAITEGEVLVSKGRSTEEMTEWEIIEEGEKVEEGISIKTGDSSKAVIELDDGSAVRLNANSEIMFDTLNSNEIIIDQISGESYHRVEKDESREYIVTSVENNEYFQVTALGTAFDVNLGEEVTVKCLESKVNIKYAENEPEELVTEGNEILIKEMTRAEVRGIEAESLDNEWYEFNKGQDKELQAQLGIFANDDAPTITISEPQDNTETTNETVTIRGTTDSNAIVKMKIGDNWEVLEIIEGSFEKEVNLNIGENKFEIKAYNQAGVKTEKTLSIKRNKIITTQNTTTTAETKTFQITSISSPEAGKISVNWKMSGYDEKSGFKVVFSTNANPEYPNRSGDYYYYTSNGSARSATFTHDQLKSGGTFHVRVCRYESGTCDIYTNDQTVTVSKIEEIVKSEETVENWSNPNISLTKISETEDTVTLSWSVVEGANTSQGFKVVWSTSHNPTYPENQTSNAIEPENKSVWSQIIGIFKPNPVYATVQLKTWGYSYLSNANVRSSTITISKSEYETGTYYIRVGRYRGDYCDYYSNEISFNLN